MKRIIPTEVIAMKEELLEKIALIKPIGIILEREVLEEKEIEARDRRRKYMNNARFIAFHAVQIYDLRKTFTAKSVVATPHKYSFLCKYLGGHIMPARFRARRLEKRSLLTAGSIPIAIWAGCSFSMFAIAAAFSSVL
jgi:hypothetical protein